MATPGLPGWQAQILRGVGAPLTPQNLLFVNDWQRAEGGTAANNPFNTTQPAGGATAYNGVGVRNYETPQQGIQATVQTLENGRYGNILGALKQGTNAKAAAQALADSPWGTGALVLKMLGGAPGASAVPAAPAASATVARPGRAGAVANMNPALLARLIKSNDNLIGIQAPAGLDQLFAPTATATPTPGAGVLPHATIAQTEPASPAAKLPANLAHLIQGNTQGEQTQFLADLARLAQYEGGPVEINSGRRDEAKQAQLYATSVANGTPGIQPDGLPVAKPGTSLHEKGLAADGTVKGVPLGRIPASILARFGLATVPGDSVHVQLAGA